jgi:uncharacterized protein YkwD
MRTMISLLFFLPLFAASQVDYYTLSAEEALKFVSFHKPIDVKNPDLEVLEACVFHVTNIERQKRKMTLFAWHQELMESAEFHANYMSESMTFSHYNRKEARFRQSHQRIHHFSPNRYSATGENIAQTFLLNYDSGKDYVCRKEDGALVFLYWNTTSEIRPHSYWSFAEEVVEGWMKSKGHRDNILYSGFDELGIGIQLVPERDWDDIPTVNVVQNFGGKK